MSFKFPFLHRSSAALTTAGRTKQRLRVALPDSRSIIYAIGDVHGCLDLLLKIEARINYDAAQYQDRQKVIVMLGDVIDRGPRSAAVLDHLICQPGPGFSRFVLAGNHEAAMLAFLDSPRAGEQWLEIGGLQTLVSYGIPVDPHRRGQRARRRLASITATVVPDEHVRFLRELPVALTWNQYLFVHAGIRPELPLEQQLDADLQGIRKEFTTSTTDHGVIVVHGHTPGPEPLCYANRISLDVAPYATGRIAAARFDGGEVKFFVSGSATPSEARVAQ